MLVPAVAQRRSENTGGALGILKEARDLFCWRMYDFWRLAMLELERSRDLRASACKFNDAQVTAGARFKVGRSEERGAGFGNVRD